jgi:1-deoxy-D-xylulose-5-phosphate reductoisomerase
MNADLPDNRDGDRADGDRPRAAMRKRRLVVLGSTGSVGQNTLEVAARFPERIEVVGLAARSRVDLLREQAARFGVRELALADAEVAREAGIPGGDEAVHHLAALAGADCVMNAIVGAAGLEPSLAAIEAGKSLALANKESLVVAGELLTAAARRSGTEILPIDSEHNAALQCLGRAAPEEVERLILTASGGPFRRTPREELSRVSLAEVLNHPTWSMGPRITVDSATLLNKGFEVIEARWLFELPLERVQVLVHPQSVVHAMLHLRDGSLIAMMSSPDMRIPIQYALSYPERWPAEWKELDLAQIGSLSFEEPDLDRFPCLLLALEVARLGGTAPAVLNAADEELVEALLAGRLHFSELPALLRQVVEEHTPAAADSLEAIRAADRWARDQVRTRLEALPQITHGVRS